MLKPCKHSRLSKLMSTVHTSIGLLLDTLQFDLINSYYESELCRAYGLNLR